MSSSHWKALSCFSLGEWSVPSPCSESGQKDTALLRIKFGRQRVKYENQDLSPFCHYLPFHIVIFYTEDSLKYVIAKQQNQKLSRQLQINFKISMSALQNLPWIMQLSFLDLGKLQGPAQPACKEWTSSWENCLPHDVISPVSDGKVSPTFNSHRIWI